MVFLSLTLLAPLLVSTAVATPAKLKVSGCSLKNAHVNQPSTAVLPTSANPISFVALGVGTQNYTCSSAGTYASAGAVANIYDISCLYGKPLFDSLPDIAIKVWKALPSKLSSKVLESQTTLAAPTHLGEHYFVPNPNTGVGINPNWDFKRSFPGNAEAYVIAARNSSSPSPQGTDHVDWLYLTSMKGSLANEIYRTDTRLGQPPKSCTVGSAPIQVKYVSYYWLTGGTVKKA